jgi:hypothetical protein
VLLNEQLAGTKYEQLRTYFQIMNEQPLSRGSVTFGSTLAQYGLQNNYSSRTNFSLLAKLLSFAKETIDFSRMESQFQPTVRSVCYFRRKLKLHAAEAGGLFDPLLEVVRLKLRLHATKVGDLFSE